MTVFLKYAIIGSMRYKYILKLKSLVVNYPYQYTARKGGVIGLYSSKVKAEARREEYILENNKQVKESDKSVLTTLTEEDFIIDKVEWD